MIPIDKTNLIGFIRFNLAGESHYLMFRGKAVDRKRNNDTLCTAWIMHAYICRCSNNLSTRRFWHARAFWDVNQQWETIFRGALILSFLCPGITCILFRSNSTELADEFFLRTEWNIYLSLVWTSKNSVVIDITRYIIYNAFQIHVIMGNILKLRYPYRLHCNFLWAKKYMYIDLLMIFMRLRVMLWNTYI